VPKDSDSTGLLDSSPEQSDESTEASEVDDLEDVGMFIEQYLPADEVASTSAPSTAENLVRQA
jgi:hypothetical protein